VHGHCYGTLKATLNSAVQSGQDLLLVIDIKGAENVKRTFPSDSFILFISPPNLSVLRQRLIGRGERDEAELKKRLETAEAEFSKLFASSSAKDGVIDYFLVNEDLSVTAEAARSILRAERSRLTRIAHESLETVRSNK
jgi:guanylate kinase